MKPNIFEIYIDRDGFWRWRLWSGNKKIIADSGQGYSTKSNAKRAINSMMAKFEIQ